MDPRVTHGQAVGRIEQLLGGQHGDEGLRAPGGRLEHPAGETQGRMDLVGGRAGPAHVLTEHGRMAAFISRFDQQVAVGGVGSRHVIEVVEQEAHENPLEPDAGAAQGGALVAAVGHALLLAHGIPLRCAVERELLGRQVIGGVVDGPVPVDLTERVVGVLFGGGDQTVGLRGKNRGHVIVITMLVATIKMTSVTPAVGRVPQAVAFVTPARS
jgi:hypothetical protein